MFRYLTGMNSRERMRAAETSDTSCGNVIAAKTITVYEVAFAIEPLVEKQYTVQFTDKSTGELTVWAWDFNDGFSSWEQNPVHTWKSPGTYDVGA